MKHRSRRSPLFPALALPLLALPLASQTLTTVTLPNGTDAVDAVGSNTLPWGRAQNGPARAQYLYDTSHFAAQGISQEIEIRHLRWRSNATATTWAGGVYFNVVVGLSSSSRDALLPSTTFAVNQGTNHTVVYNGSVIFAPGTATASAPGPVVIDLPLSTPFRFDPSLGQDLLIDIDIPPGQWAGGTVVACDAQSTSPGCSRISATATYGGPTGTISNGQQALVVELGYVLTDFLDADFVASVTSGPSPLTVTFSDLSTTSDPSGVVAWAWDFDNDGLIDSTLQNPTHTFSSCGSYSVSLQVSDTQHAPDTETILDYIVTDEVVPDFTIQHLGGTTFLFTDTSTPPATAVNWDLDGDQVVDATGSTTTFSYTSTCIATNVTMSASRQCMGPFPITKAVALSPGQVATTTTAGISTSGSGFDWPGILFDVRVTNPQGIVICALSLPSGASSGHVEFDVNITEGSYVGKDTSPAEWRLAAWGGFDAPETTASNPQLTVV
ncbi:MAG: PKD domain-containing protein, partial [Planctomycetota bacterium]